MFTPSNSGAQNQVSQIEQLCSCVSYTLLIMRPLLFEVETTEINRREKIVENMFQKSLALAVKAALPVVAGSVGGFVALTYPHLFANFCQLGG